MKKEMIAKAWKDPEFRARLSASEREALPECPSGLPLSESELLGIIGGRLALGPSTGCTDGGHATCGIIMCAER